MTDQAAVVAVRQMSVTDETGTSAPFRGFFALSFFAQDAGWAYGQSTDGQYVLGLTEDAGETWILRRLPWACSGSGAGVRSILFRDSQVGWVWCNYLWATDNGGKTWTTEMSGADILSWGRSSAGWYWILWETPDAGLHLQELTGPHRDSWVDPETVPSVWTVTGIADWGTPPIDVVDDRTVLISAVKRDSLQSHRYAGWWLTTDGGTTWRQVIMPCVGGAIEDRTIALATQDVLWVDCGGMGAMQGIPKAFYRSGDGGQTWQIMASTSPEILTGETPVARLPWRAFAFRLVALDGDFTYSFLHGINRPAITHDAGRTWRFPFLGPCVPFEMIADGVFVDKRHGYAVGSGGLARTADGGLTWECLLYPQP